MVSSINSNTATSIIEEMQNHNLESKVIKKEQEQLKKYEDEVSITNKRISGLGQFKTLLEDLSNQISSFTFNRFDKIGIFDAKKVIAPKELTESYANVKAKPGVSNQDIPLEIIQMAKGQILGGYNLYKPEDKMQTVSFNSVCDSSDAVVFNVLDNGMKSKEFGNKNMNVVGDGENQFKKGKFSIGNSQEVIIESGDTLKKIVNKINDATKARGEGQDPHVIAEVVKNDATGKYFIWIRSDAKHHGIQNKFEINGTNKGQFSQYNEKVVIPFNEELMVATFVANLKQNAKKADIEVMYNPNETENGGRILLKSLLTGEGNEMKVDGYMHEDSSGVTSPDYIHLEKIQGASNAKIKVDGIEIISKTNTIETEDLKIDLFGGLKESESPKNFNLRITNDTEGLYDKFEELAKTYNNLSVFIAQHSLKIHDTQIYSKPAINATLSRYNEALSQINDQLFDYFRQFNQNGNYVKENQVSDLGISIIPREVTPPPETIGNVEQDYMPVQYNELVIDKKKLQKAIEEKFDTFKEILSYQFDSTNTEFHLINNHKNVNFEAQGVKNLEYTVDYGKIKYMTNISKEKRANEKVNGSLTDKSYFLINDVKIPVDKDTTYASLVDEINKHSSETKIRTDLLDSSDKIVSIENLEANPGVRIALSLYYKTEEERKKVEEGRSVINKQDDLRKSLVLIDTKNLLGAIFQSTAGKLDSDVENSVLDNKIPQINFFDTSSVVNIKVNLQNDEKQEPPAYLKLIDSKKYEEGGVVKILPKLDTSKSNQHVNLQDFEVAYLGKSGGSAMITVKQGIADKINNVLVSYTEHDGTIEQFIQYEKEDKIRQESSLSLEKEVFKYKKAKIERDFAKIKAAEMKLAAQQEYFRVFNNSNNNNS